MAATPTSLLAQGERVVRNAHQHWFVLVWRARAARSSRLIIAALRHGRAAAVNSDIDGLLWTVLGWRRRVILRRDRPRLVACGASSGTAPRST